jgi:hypothetical protein
MKILIALFLSSLAFSGFGQCTNPNAFGSTTAPTSNVPVTITTCAFFNEYQTVTGVIAGTTFTSTNSPVGCITVHSGTFNGPVVAFGPSPLNWTAAAAGSYFIHNTVNCACATSTGTCVTATLTCTNCVTGPCTSITNIAGCGIAFGLSTTGASAYVANICSPTPGLESIYSYTATSTGAYSLNINSITGGSYAFGWKLASAGCSGTGWNCIGTMAAPGVTPTFNFISGTTYYFLIDAMQTTASTVNFQLTCPTGGPIVASDCGVAVNVCSSAAFVIDPNGFGAINEICAAGTCTSNPIINPSGSGNSGCLLSGELNSTWMKVNVLTGGNLNFALGTPSSGTFNCLDWAMWPYNAATCGAISAGTLAPIRCNYNGACEEYTGLAGAMPAGATSTTNWEPPLAVASGSIYLICLSNFSSANTSVPLNFSGTAVVSCTPLSINDLILMGLPETDMNRLNWKVLGELNVSHYTVERSTNGIDFEPIGFVQSLGSTLEELNYSYDDYTSEMGMNYYQIRANKTNGTNTISQVIAIQSSTKKALKIISTYPNPASEEFSVKLVSQKKEDILVKIIGIDGKIYRQNTFAITEGVNILELQTENQKGIFFIEISSNSSGVVAVEKIIFD